MNFIFTLLEAEANLIMSALQELPFKHSAGLIQKLLDQAKDQNKSDAPSDAPAS
jgi:hypothetical protein